MSENVKRGSPTNRYHFGQIIFFWFTKKQGQVSRPHFEQHTMIPALSWIAFTDVRYKVHHYLSLLYDLAHYDDSIELRRSRVNSCCQFLIEHIQALGIGAKEFNFGN